MPRHPKKRGEDDEGRLCSTCGNPVSDAAVTCPFCGHPLSPESFAARGSDDCLSVNLEWYMPSVADAQARLREEVARARESRARLLRVVHGWGSSGKGGKLAAGVRQVLEALAGRGEIRGFVNGEELTPAHVRGRALLARHPKWAALSRQDQGNPGVTIVEL